MYYDTSYIIIIDTQRKKTHNATYQHNIKQQRTYNKIKKQTKNKQNKRKQNNT